MLKIGFALLLVLLCIGLGVAASENDTYIYTKDIGDAKGVEIIKVHFINSFRGADTNIATVDRVWQVSDSNPDLEIRNTSNKVIITSATPLNLEEGYQLDIKSINVSGVDAYVELSKDNETIDSAMLIPPNLPDETYTYTKEIGGAKGVDIIKVHFKNIFRGPDTNIAIVDRIWQVSDANQSIVICNSSDEVTIDSANPLELAEGYEIDIRAVDVQGTKAYIELYKNKSVLDSKIIVPLPAIWYGTALYLYDLGKYNEAIEAYDKVIELDQNNTYAWIGKGNAFRSLGKQNEAIEAYNRAIKTAPEYSLALTNVGNTLRSIGKYNEAMNAYEKAEDEWALVELGNFLKGLGKSNESIAAYETAIRVDDGAIKRYPNYAEAWANKGAALTSLGNYAESIAAYGKALEIDRNYTYAWNEKGRAFAALGKYNESIEAYDRAIGINPEYEWAWANKGVALDNLGKYDEASKAFEEAKRLAPERFGGWNATEYGLQHSPDWMEVKTYSQGRGLHAYIILYNNAGLMIRANGVLRIEIFEGDSKLWSKSYTVKAEDFVDTAAGLGAFAHPVTLWDAGRISYDTIKPGLGDLTLEKSVYMEIRAYFETTNGRVLKDKTTSYVS